MGLEDAVLIRTSNTLKYEDNYVLMLDRRRFPEQEPGRDILATKK